MGWSCTTKASDTEQKWMRHCIKVSGTQNVFKSEGREMFYEIERTEFDDGRIVGEIISASGHVVGKFRINGDGTVAEAPKILREVARANEVRRMNDNRPKEVQI